MLGTCWIVEQPLLMLSLLSTYCVLNGGWGYYGNRIVPFLKDYKVLFGIVYSVAESAFHIPNI